MVLAEAILAFVLVGSALGLLLVFVLYPLVVVLVATLRGREGKAGGAAPVPSASLLVALRNAEGLVDQKVENCLALQSSVPLQIVFASDGSTDRTVERLRAAGGTRIEVLEVKEHVGKAHALNLGAERCRGEVLILSDADALLAPDAVEALLARYEPGVGGVCGQRVIGEREGELVEAQGSYIAADSALKRAESRAGSVTSNDGKLYSIRRALFRPIAPGATDDLYTCLNVIQQGQRFVFEPRARAYVRTPSRSARHELSRRRRIVSRSLRGIYLMRTLLNPLRFGGFSFQLLINKVCRRLLPLFLIAFFVASAGLALRHPWARLLSGAQLAFYALAFLHSALRRVPLLRRGTSVAYYFCVGNAGTLLGLLDFARGKETVKWDPVKAD